MHFARPRVRRHRACCYFWPRYAAVTGIDVPSRVLFESNSFTRPRCACSQIALERSKSDIWQLLYLSCGTTHQHTSMLTSHFAHNGARRCHHLPLSCHGILFCYVSTVNPATCFTGKSFLCLKPRVRQNEPRNTRYSNQKIFLYVSVLLFECCVASKLHLAP